MPSDIDSKRMMLTIRKSKGKRTREVPLPEFTLEKLREYWVTHKNPNFIFPFLGQNLKEGSAATRHMRKDSVHEALKKVREELGLKKKVTPHTLRHCYATHLLDAGVNIRMVQKFLGHSSIKTTCMYLHVTKFGLEKSVKVMASIFKNHGRVEPEGGYGYEQNPTDF